MQDIQRQWTPPVRREMLEDTMSRAHPEEHLRDCDMPYAWAQLKTAPHATFQLKKAIREKWVSSSCGLSGREGGGGGREGGSVCVCVCV